MKQNNSTSEIIEKIKEKKSCNYFISIIMIEIYMQHFLIKIYRFLFWKQYSANCFYDCKYSHLIPINNIIWPAVCNCWYTQVIIKMHSDGKKIGSLYHSGGAISWLLHHAGVCFHSVSSQTQHSFSCVSLAINCVQ